MENLRKSDCGKYEKIRIESGERIKLLLYHRFFSSQNLFLRTTIVVKCGKLTKNLNAAREWVSLR